VTEDPFVTHRGLLFTVVLAYAARMPDLAASPAWLNGMPGVRIDVAGLTIAVSLAVKDGRIIRIFAIANPLKLGWLDRTAVLCR
jgi:RNA polymerase sigma-70 factor (ECF subfamily)